MLPQSGINLYKKIVMEMTNEQLYNEILHPLWAKHYRPVTVKEFQHRLTECGFFKEKPNEV